MEQFLTYRHIQGENFIKTTLVEGKVGVTLNNMKSGSEINLMPGQQLTYNKEPAVLKQQM